MPDEISSSKKRSQETSQPRNYPEEEAIGDLNNSDAGSVSDFSGGASVDSTERSIKELEAGMQELQEETERFESGVYLREQASDGHSDA